MDKWQNLAHSMDMKKGLGISVILHLSLLGLVILLSAQKVEVSAVNSTETLTLLSPQRSQQKRIKGQKQAITPEEELSSDRPSRQVVTGPLGNDSEDAPAIQGGSPHPQLLAVASYAQRLTTYIEQHRFYPRRALALQQTGTVKVRLRINAQGEFTNVEVIEPSPYDTLNRAAYDLVTELGSFQPLPAVYKGNGDFVVPIRYSL